VRQAKARTGNDATFVHRDTYVGPENAGRQDIDMAFWVVGVGGSRVLREAYGTMDSETCEVQLRSMTNAI
jgi:hypothetical protein